MLRAPELAPSHEDFPSLPSVVPCHKPPPSPTSTGHPHIPRAHQPFPPCVFHLPCHTLPTSAPSQPLTAHTTAVQITPSADRTKDRPFSVSAASSSSPNLHTSRHLSEKKSPLKPKSVWGWMLGRGRLFCPCCPDTPASSTIAAWLPPQPQTNVASLLTCYLKPVPRLAHSSFRLMIWSHWGQAVSLSPAQGQVPTQQSSCLLRIRPAHLVTCGFVLLLHLKRIIP